MILACFLYDLSVLFWDVDISFSVFKASFLLYQIHNLNQDMISDQLPETYDSFTITSKHFLKLYYNGTNSLYKSFCFAQNMNRIK